MIELFPHSPRPVPDFRKAGAKRSNTGFASIRIVMVLLAIFLCACAVMALQEKTPTGSPHGKSIKNSCSDCHTASGWNPIQSSPAFDHGTTGFPLKEMHKDLDCTHCHLKLNFSNIGTQCTDCHADIHRRQLSADCEDCHTLRGWREITQNVNGHVNRFPLMGAHAALECESCHTGAGVGQFRGLRTDCDSCHHEDYLNAASVDHQTAGFSLNCELCHSVDGWFSRFNHSAFTGFPLAGAHATLDCLDCHSSGNFSGTPADCVECHLQDYNGTTDPNHALAGFPQDCTQCHTTSGWGGAAFNHINTQFPLTGVHSTLLCQDCHSSGQYAGLPSDCYACHSQTYTATTNPDHVAAGFPQDCTQCHTTSGWGDADFNHTNTQFPLTGAHTSLLCQDCHSSRQYAGLPSACYACHSQDYTSTTDPGHTAAGFSQDCTQCHSTSRWAGAEYVQHTSFPIYSGRHDGAWTACSDCHTTTGNYGVFSCLGCHERTVTDSHHTDVSGYVYNSTNCYACHSDGRADD